MTIPESVYITREGYNSLKGEYDGLISSTRKELAQKIKDAREQGDLSENAAYKTAKEDQAFVERRIAELEVILKGAKVVDHPGKCREVGVGCRVKVSLADADHEFQIVGALEADPTRNRISHVSPLGSALMGKKAGDEAKIETPLGSLVYVIRSID